MYTRDTPFQRGIAQFVILSNSNCLVSDSLPSALNLFIPYFLKSTIVLHLKVNIYIFIIAVLIKSLFFPDSSALYPDLSRTTCGTNFTNGQTCLKGGSGSAFFCSELFDPQHRWLMLDGDDANVLCRNQAQV